MRPRAHQLRPLRRWLYTGVSRPVPARGLNTPGRVLWSYFTAPSNLLFVSTNLLGLSIVASWRGLKSVAGERSVEFYGEDGVMPVSVEFDKVERLKHGILDEVDTDVFHEECQVHDVRNERIQAMITDQILLLFHSHEQLDEMLRAGMDEEFFRALDKKDRQRLMRQMLKMIDTEVQEIKSFEDFISQVPTDEIREQLCQISPRALLENIQSTYRDPSYEQMEKMGRQYSAKGNDLNKFIEESRTTPEFSPKLLLSSIPAVYGTNFSQLHISSLFTQLHADPQNENLMALSNIVAHSFLRTTHIHAEPHLINIINSGAMTQNTPLLMEILTKLQLTDRQTSNRTLIHKITRGQHTSLTPHAHITLLRSLTDMDVGERTLLTALHRLLTFLRLEDGEVRVKTYSTAARPNMGAQRAWEHLPLELLEVALRIGIKYDQSDVLGWCMERLEQKCKNGEVDPEALERLKERMG